MSTKNDDRIKWKTEDVPMDAIMRRRMGVTSLYGMRPRGISDPEDAAGWHELRNDCSWTDLKERIYKSENWEWISEGPRLT